MMACLRSLAEQLVLKQESYLNSVLGMSQILGSIDATLQREGETAAYASRCGAVNVFFLINFCA